MKLKMKKNVFLIALMAILLMSPFESLQSKGEFTDGLREKILLRGKLGSPKKAFKNKPNISDIPAEAWIDGNLITITFDKPLYNPGLSIIIKDEYEVVIHSDYLTVDVSNSICFDFERDQDKDYCIEITNESCFLYGYF